MSSKIELGKDRPSNCLEGLFTRTIGKPYDSLSPEDRSLVDAYVASRDADGDIVCEVSGCIGWCMLEAAKMPNSEVVEIFGGNDASLEFCSYGELPENKTH